MLFCSLLPIVCTLSLYYSFMNNKQEFELCLLSIPFSGLKFAVYTYQRYWTLRLCITMNTIVNGFQFQPTCQIFVKDLCFFSPKIPHFMSQCQKLQFFIRVISHWIFLMRSDPSLVKSKKCLTFPATKNFMWKIFHIQ